jgi:hypothetical protein
MDNKRKIPLKIALVWGIYLLYINTIQIKISNILSLIQMKDSNLGGLYTLWGYLEVILPFLLMVYSCFLIYKLKKGDKI